MMKKTILAAGAAALALGALSGGAQAGKFKFYGGYYKHHWGHHGYYGHGYYGHHGYYKRCWWYKKKYHITRNPYWWKKYVWCIRR